MDHISLFIASGSVIITIWVDISKVDGGDCMSAPSLQHAASQAPLLGVRAELQDLVISMVSTIKAMAAWI